MAPAIPRIVAALRRCPAPDPTATSGPWPLQESPAVARPRARPSTPGPGTAPGVHCARLQAPAPSSRGPIAHRIPAPGAQGTLGRLGPQVTPDRCLRQLMGQAPLGILLRQGKLTILQQAESSNLLKLTTPDKANELRKKAKQRLNSSL